MFFLLCIYDLHFSIYVANLVMFADDIKVLITDSDICAFESKIDRLTTELETWFNTNGLIINVGKTGVCHFTIDNQIFR